MPKNEANHSPQPNVELRNAISFISNPTVLMHKANFTQIKVTGRWNEASKVRISVAAWMFGLRYFLVYVKLPKHRQALRWSHPSSKSSIMSP